MNLYLYITAYTYIHTYMYFIINVVVYSVETLYENLCVCVRVR